MRLSDLCDLITVQVDPRDRPNDIYVGLEHITSGRLARTGEGRGTDVQSAKYAFRAGDILYGKLRPYLDKAILVDDNGLCTTELLVLRPKAGVDPRFVVGVVHAPDFVKHAVAGTTGAQHPRTSWSHIASFGLPVLEAGEQTKVAELLWRAHEAIDTNEKTIDAGRKLKRAAMRVLFTRGLRGEARKETEVGFVPESWRMHPVADLGNIVTGSTPPTGEPANYRDGNIPFISPGDIEHGTAIGSTEKHITTTGLESACAIAKGTTCFVCIGSTIGKVAYTTTTLSTTNQQINSIIPNSHFDPLFVFHLMTHWADHLSKQASPSPIPILSKGVFEQIKIYSPTNTEEQKEIASTLDAIDHKIDLHRRKRAVLDNLFKTLLHKLMICEIRAADLDSLAPLENEPIHRSCAAGNIHDQEIRA